LKPVDVMPHQQKAVKELSNGKILNGGVGTGKSRVSIRYYLENEKGRDIYVITTAKKRDKRDWESEAILHGISTDESMPGLGRIKVDSWNNIGKYVGIENAFFIFDEQRVVGSGAWVKSFLKICKINHWILLTATPGDTWLDYIPVMVANGYYKNRSAFIAEHVVYSYFGGYPKVDRFINTGRLVRIRKELLVSMPYERHTTRHLVKTRVEHDEDAIQKARKKRWNPFTDSPMIDASEFVRVARRLVNGHPSRIKALQDLMQKHPKIIVFYNFNYELEDLRKLACPLGEGCSCGLVVTEWNGHNHQEIPNSDRWLYLVQYQAGAEGWNCIDTDAMVFYSLTYSYRNFEQAQGRTDRLNTPFKDLWYYIFMSDAPIDRDIKRSLDGKQDFNERKSETYQSFDTAA
jgi:Arc/MetJ-type ribon-helix-helix transcriptional regulator